MHINEILVASHNAGKVKEIKELLSPLGIKVYSASEKNLPDVDETGTTFQENALLKAQSAAQHTGLPALADDSGLCVEALNGRPGVYTARYGGYEKLLLNMKNIPQNQRKASFHCTLALCIPHTGPVFFEGISTGMISLVPQGNDGFGYDPIFIPSGDTRTYAEMTANEKHQTSHRAEALSKLIAFLQI